MTESYRDEFEAPNRLLLGAGPCTVHPRVLRAMTQPVVGHLDPVFFQVMDEVCEMLRQVFHTRNQVTMPISATGTGAMETACVNVIERGDTAIVCRNGYFGVRLADIAQRCGANTIMVDSPWGKPADLNALEDALNANPGTKMVGLVHAETSTGAITPLQDAIDLTHRHGALVVADAVTSLGSHNVQVDDWDIDVCYSASQKCLGAPPGLAPISFGERAMSVIDKRASTVESFYFNLQGVAEYWNETQRVYHHTSPITMIYAMRESLRMMMEEGLDEQHDRHARVAGGLRAGLTAMGLDLATDPDYQLNPITVVNAPEGVNEAEVRARLLNEFDIEVSGGLGEFRGRVWRVGMMGNGAREGSVLSLLSALEVILGDMDYEVAYGASVAAAQRSFASHGD
ncbi:MAG: alanine--glyoxylate aminotransferase family protein [Chloroflexi bacterium]|nr:alanine--glyoxylate aminotransferase family protein [Chloroflexota bacterium]